MLTKRLTNVLAALLLIVAQPFSPLAKPSPPQAARADESQSQANKDKTSQTTNEGAQHTPRGASEEATRLRRILPVLPSLIRGGDGLLSTEGQRATQSQLVTSTNVKDPVTDAFSFTSGLPVETANPVQIPSEQFSVSLAKFYATVPVLDSISGSGWNFALGAPFFAIGRADGKWRGLRSAAPMASATGPLFGGKLMLYQSFAYALSKQTVESIFDTRNDSRFQSYDSNTHADIRARRGHLVSSRLALFSQDIDSATLNALTVPEATPDYLLQGGQLSFSDAYATQSGMILDSSVSYKNMRVRVRPRGSAPMIFVEQGEIFGNYFDNVRHNGSRFEWKEGLQLPEKSGWGNHHIGFGGGLARAAFDSVRVGNKLVLTGEDADELFSVTTFTGSPFESLSEHEMTGWAEDRWSPTRRASLTAGLRYDWTALSRRSQWAPRAGFSLLPFHNDRTVIRGGAGVFYDILPLTAGTFTRSRHRVMQFFDEAEPISEPRALGNLTTRPYLRTPHLLGWNLEIDQQVAGRLFLRVKAEERRGRNLLLLNPDKPGRSVTALVLSDTGSSLYREFEATASYRPSRWSNLNGSYVRSSSRGDLGTFNAVMGTFEKLVISSSRYAHSRSEAPNRFLIWGDVRVPGSVTVSPALDVHTGFPYAFFDADNKVPTEVDFSRFPRTFSLDMGLYRDLKVMAFDRQGRLRLGVRVYNLTNHFNPRDVELDHGHSEETQDQLFLKGYFNGVGRSYRASATFNF
jgi:hypothetical protein